MTEHNPNLHESRVTRGQWRRSVPGDSVYRRRDRQSSTTSQVEIYRTSDRHFSPEHERRSASHPGIRNRRQDIEPVALSYQEYKTSPIRAQYYEEPAFRGNADYQLFVEATFGLGPDFPRTYRTSFSAPEDDQGTVHVDHLGSDASQYATQYSTPQVSQQSFHESSHASDPFGYDDGYASVASPHESHRNSSDDELPDYEESQAQMEQQARSAAMRRAQELQRRWRIANP
ncbi:hypothetical protein AAFC00_004728 [Neodothiora populina]|uniref:Uncharacterized protein n=1 Tax=Neodothiora populina TaxID=2781224 RepID=A0ABR3P2Z1_9PEZI